jgi:hypothetical protein
VSPAFAGCQVPIGPLQHRARQRRLPGARLNRRNNRRGDETIFVVRRRRPETEMRFHDLVKQGDAIMLAFILNSIYREVLRTSLSGMHRLA